MGRQSLEFTFSGEERSQVTRALQGSSEVHVKSTSRNIVEEDGRLSDSLATSEKECKRLNEGWNIAKNQISDLEKTSNDAGDELHHQLDQLAFSEKERRKLSKSKRNAQEEISDW